MTEKPNSEGASNRRLDWDSSAQLYDLYACQQKLYRESAAHLLRFAELSAGMTIVDLGCGTGIVTEAILGTPEGKESKIIAIDFSPEMLAFAKKRAGNGNVEFHCEAAENLSRVVQTQVDRIVCNAAFWHFDTKRVFAEISKILKPGGKCLIGMPPQQFREMNISTLYEKEKVLWMILEEKVTRGLMWGQMGDPKAGQKSATEKNDIMQDLSGYGLTLSRIESGDINIPAREYVAFLRIPVMARHSFLFKGLHEGEAQDIVDVVSNQLEWLRVPDSLITWHVYVIEKAGVFPPGS